MSVKKKILLLSAYRSDSHASWADWLQREIDVDWRVLELPGRYFRWRIRGNPLSWLDQLSQLLDGWQPDQILATSMVDIATIKGLFPKLASVPLDYYFHENQFAYPVGDGQHSSLDPQMVQLYGALAADRIWFNSHFNQQSFFNGIKQLLKKLPDEKPQFLVERLKEKSDWLPVPVKPVERDPQTAKIPNLILWNHRWEYDKRPDLFLEALKQLKADNVDFRLALLGHRAPKKPEILQQIESEFSEQILVNGRVSRAKYECWLQQASVIISTAIHEFQGLSVLEACSAGAIPVVPDDLCYREQYPTENRFRCGDVQEICEKIQQAFKQELAAANVENWLSTSTAPQWQKLLSEPN